MNLLYNVNVCLILKSKLGNNVKPIEVLNECMDIKGYCQALEDIPSNFENFPSNINEHMSIKRTLTPNNMMNSTEDEFEYTYYLSVLKKQSFIANMPFELKLTEVSNYQKEIKELKSFCKKYFIDFKKEDIRILIDSEDNNEFE